MKRYKKPEVKVSMLRMVRLFCTSTDQTIVEDTTKPSAAKNNDLLDYSEDFGMFK